MSEEKVFEGFSRVVIDHEGTAVSMRKAFEMGFSPDVGFMRGDGWSLGAPKELEYVAQRIWANEWKYKIEKPQTYWTKL
jgi:hypothetical protein